MFENLFNTYRSTTPPKIETPDVVENMQLFDHISSAELNNLNYAPLKEKEVENKKQEDRFVIPDLQPVIFKQKPSNHSPDSSNIVNTARLFVGTVPYVWGGTTPKGFDCSGLINYSFKQNGINMPRTVSEIEKGGNEVNGLQNIQEGDLLCFKSRGPSGKHIKMVSKIDGDRIFTIDARGKNQGIVEEELQDVSKLTTIRRYMGSRSRNTSVTKDSFASIMIPALSNALRSHGEDPNKWLPTLLAHVSIESNWGKSKLSTQDNNYAGIKGKGNTYASREVIDGENVMKSSSFKRYESVQDFARDYVDLLQRKYNLFAYNPDQFSDVLKSKGYFTEDINKHKSQMRDRLKWVNKLI